MTEWILIWTPWHWVILGLILLLLELFGTAGLLLWTGIAALVTGLLSAVIPWAFATEWWIFAGLCVITTYCWYHFYRKKDKANGEEQSTLNQRGARCIGQTAPLLDDMQNGKGRIRLDDTYWTVTATQNWPKGTMVTVDHCEGALLVVHADQTEH